jgi:hypothetical protein
MELLHKTLNWYVRHKNAIDFIKDVVFFIGAAATFVGFYQFIKFLAQRKILNKKQEMENDSRLYDEIHEKLKEYVDNYGATLGDLRDMGIRLLYIKNYPYKLEDDGYGHMLYYYFMSEHHKASGYISTKGLYVLEHLWFLSTAIYYNPKSEKWFIDEAGLSFKGFKELKHKQLVKRIPFANIYGYDFDSDWADKGEPVFYTKYKYYKWKLYADDLTAVSIDEEHHLANAAHLKKSKRTKRLRSLIKRLRRKIKIHFMNRKRRK